MHALSDVNEVRDHNVAMLWDKLASTKQTVYGKSAEIRGNKSHATFFRMRNSTRRPNSLLTVKGKLRRLIAQARLPHKMATATTAYGTLLSSNS